MLDRWRLQAGMRQGLLALALLVLLAQSLGLAHRLAHAGHVGIGQQSFIVQGMTQALAQGSPSESTELSCATTASWGWVFGEHNSTADCQLYDQLCHDAPIAGVGLALGVAMPLAWLRLGLRERFALHARFFSARAPPLF
jgi:hypothetical protein